MSRDQDPAGYYSALGVGASATLDEIKRAFKAKAQQVHPDKNSAPDATRRFQAINEAYRILGDPESRSRYDSLGIGSAQDQSEEQDRPSSWESLDLDVDPIVCSVCQKISAQPRYVIYTSVVSMIVVIRKGGYQGVYCSECGAKASYKASIKTLFLGWWAFPWGPIYSARAIYDNLIGGIKPPLTNVRFLSWQALYFHSKSMSCGGR